MLVSAEIQEAKQAAKREFGELDGVQGFGIGDAELIVYVRDIRVKNKIPAKFHGFPVQTIVTGAAHAV